MPTMWPWSFRRVFGDYRRDSRRWMHWPTRGGNRPKRQAGRSYGIDARPAELAFVNHFTGCVLLSDRKILQ